MSCRPCLTSQFELSIQACSAYAVGSCRPLCKYSFARTVRGGLISAACDQSESWEDLILSLAYIINCDRFDGGPVEDPRRPRSLRRRAAVWTTAASVNSTLCFGEHCTNTLILLLTRKRRYVLQRGCRVYRPSPTHAENELPCLLPGTRIPQDDKLRGLGILSCSLPYPQHFLPR